MKNIMAVNINGRTASAPKVQEVLTKYGCSIRTRVGFHEVNEDQCSMDGLIILQLFGNDGEINEMFDELKVLEGVTPKIIDFE